MKLENNQAGTTNENEVQRKTNRSTALDLLQMLGDQVDRDEIGRAQSGEEVNAISGLEAAGTNITSANMMPRTQEQRKPWRQIGEDYAILRDQEY